MVKEDIATWLNASEQNWKEGLALLSYFSNNKNLLRVFLMRNDSARNRQFLRYELSKLIKVSPSPSRKIKKQIGKDISVLPMKSFISENNKLQSAIGEQIQDPAVADLHKKRIVLFKEYVLLFHQLLFMTKPNRKYSALRMVGMWDDITHLWSLVDYYNKYGALPAPPDKNLSTRLHTLRSYISKHNKLVANALTETTRLKYQRKLDEYTAELNDIELKLST